MQFICIFLYRFIFFFHNKNMKKNILTFIKQIAYINKKIHPTLLASSLTFFLSIAILPFYQLVLYFIAKLEITNIGINDFHHFTILQMILYTISTIWACSKFINTLHLISDVMFFEVKERPKLKIRLLSLLYTLFLLCIIIVQVVLVMYFGYIKYRCSHLIYVIISVVEIFFPMIMMFSIFTLLYKYIIPIKIKIKDVWKTGLLVSMIIYVLMILYQQVFKNVLFSKYANTYGGFAGIISLVIWLYINCYIFLVGMGIFVYKNVYK